MATAASHGDKSVVVVDGVEGPAYDNVFYESVTFSPDSQRLAYGAVKGKRHVVVVDGVEGKQYDPVTGVPTMPDAKYIVYCVFSRGELPFPVLVFNPGLAERGIGALTLSVIPYIVFSPDSRHVAYIAAEGKRVFFVVDGVEQKHDCDGILVHNKSSATHGAARRRAHERGGDYGIATEDAASPFVAGGSRFAYIAARRAMAEKQEVLTFVVIDDSEVAEPYLAIDVHVSPDGRGTAFVRTAKGGQTLVVDGKPERHDGVPWEGICFSPDSSHVSYAAREGKTYYTAEDGSLGTG